MVGQMKSRNTDNFKITGKILCSPYCTPSDTLKFRIRPVTGE